MGISPRFSNGDLTYLPSRVSITSAESVVARYNKQIDNIYLNSLISGASYGMTIDGTEAWYNASGVQVRLDILEGLRLEATTVAGNIVYASVYSGASLTLLLISSGANQAFISSNLSARLSTATLVKAQDATGVTTYVSPFAVATASNTWYQLVAPKNAAKLHLNAAVALRVGLDTGASNGFKIAANTPYVLPTTDGAAIYLHGEGAGNVTFLYELFEDA